MVSHRVRTVSEGKWNVSVETSSHSPGAKLNVYRFPFGDSSHMMMKAEGNGLIFNTSQEAWDFALERGYIRQYFIRNERKYRTAA